MATAGLNCTFSGTVGGGNFLEDGQVGGGPSEVVEILGAAPQDLLVFDRLQLAGDDPAAERQQADGPIPVVPNHWAERGSDFHLHGQFFYQFADEGGFGRLAGIDFAAGKFPQPAEVLAGRTQAGEEFARVISDHSTDDIDHDPTACALGPAAVNGVR